MRCVLSGVLPACGAVSELPDVERREVERKVTRTIVEAQQVVIDMLAAYRERTRHARVLKLEQLQVWWAEYKRVQAIKARVIKGLARIGQAARESRALQEQVAQAKRRVAEVEENRRNKARLGSECARTRSRGVHEVGKYDQVKRHKVNIGWEAGDSKLVCHGSQASTKAGRKAGFAWELHVPKIARHEHSGVGIVFGQIRCGRGAVVVSVGDRDGGGSLSSPPLHPPSPSSPMAGTDERGASLGAVRRRRTVTSRWHPHALSTFVGRIDGCGSRGVS